MFNPPRMPGCHYCNDLAHFIQDCPWLVQHKREKKIVRYNGKIRLPSGHPISAGPGSAKDRVIGHYAASMALSIWDENDAVIDEAPSRQVSIFTNAIEDQRDVIIQKLRAENASLRQPAQPVNIQTPVASLSSNDVKNVVNEALAQLLAQSAGLSDKAASTSETQGF